MLTCLAVPLEPHPPPCPSLWAWRGEGPVSALVGPGHARTPTLEGVPHTGRGPFPPNHPEAWGLPSAFVDAPVPAIRMAFWPFLPLGRDLAGTLPTKKGKNETDKEMPDPPGRRASSRSTGAPCVGSSLLGHPLPPLSKPSAWPLLRKHKCLLHKKSVDRGRAVTDTDVQVPGSLGHPLGGRVGRDGPS